MDCPHDDACFQSRVSNIVSMVVGSRIQVSRARATEFTFVARLYCHTRRSYNNEAEKVRSMGREREGKMEQATWREDRKRSRDDYDSNSRDGLYYIIQMHM